MTYQEDLARFEQNHPQQTLEAGGGLFRYFRSGDPKAPALVLLNGGMNTARMWMPYLEADFGNVQLLSFDYPREFSDNQSLMTGLHAFFQALGIEKPILVGASYGGMAAQLYTQRYPDEVGGLILFATGGLDESTLRQFKRKYFFAPLLLWYMKHCNYEKLKPKLIRSVLKDTADEPQEVQDYAREMFTHIFSDYTREKDLHITGIMADLVRQTPLIFSDLERLAGRILLILPDKDFFTPEIQEALIRLMGHPKTCIVRGGHVSTILHAPDYIREINTFLRELGY